MKLAFELAAKLGARVIGEEGEEYTLEQQIGRAADRFYNPINPFTKEPIYQQRRGSFGRWATS
jgi:hypothetical protein